MPITHNRQKYYRMSEVCKKAGVSRSTLWRWLRAGILEDSAKRDRRGWRLYTESDLKVIKDEVHKVE